MCCFSGPVRIVSGTRIFARGADDGRQLLVYSMKFAADDELAMILPIPVPPASSEDAVRFVDLSSAPMFFDALDAVFYHSTAPAPGRIAGSGGPTLQVHDVGQFQASFVPRRGDFDRLDARFRLPLTFWDTLPSYADWGFCVFKLRSERPEPEPTPSLADRLRQWSGLWSPPPPPPRKRHPDPVRVHPMAFEFPRREPGALFFPTVHVHDGFARRFAHFDHALYCQVGDAGEPAEWQPSAPGARVHGPARAWVNDEPIFRRRLNGRLENRDVVVALEGRPARASP